MARERRSKDRPFIPGTAFRFGPLHERATAMIRERMPEGGDGLFVFNTPMEIGGSTMLAVVEAYYPDEFRSSYYDQLDPPRRADFQDGKLVAIQTVELAGTIKVGKGLGSMHVAPDITQDMILELRRNARPYQRELSSASSVGDRKRELSDHIEARDDAVLTEFGEWYEWAYKETEKFAMNKPRVMGHNFS